jgi:WD40 repeat protein
LNDSCLKILVGPVALQTLEGHSDYISAVAFSPDGKQLASRSDDRTVRLWDLATGAALQALKVNAIVATLSYLDTDRGVIDTGLLFPLP